MKILIVGGGVAGLALAGLIKKYNLGKAVIAEKAPQFGSIGFVIGIWGNGRKVLEELGIDHRIVDKYGYPIRWNVVEDENGKILKAFPIDIFTKVNPTSVISRTKMQEGLAKSVEGTEIRFNTTIETVKQLENQQVEIIFSDGKKENFDLVVGADGIHSSIREKVFGNNFLKYYGWGVWVYWLPENFKHPKHVISAADKGRFYSIFPFYDKGAAWFVATVPKNTGRAIKSRLNKLKESFFDFKGYVKETLEVAPASENIFYDDLAYVDMPIWHKGRVVLVGDAQHARSPITGMGASMALEDAFVLAQELKDKNDIDSAIRGFAKRREKRIKKYHKITERFDTWSMATGLKGLLRDIFLPILPVSYFFSMIQNLMDDEI